MAKKTPPGIAKAARTLAKGTASKRERSEAAAALAERKAALAKSKKK